MHEYLYNNHGKRPAINVNERNELEFLRKEVASLKEQVKQQSSASTGVEDNDNAGSSSEDSEGDEDVLALPVDPAKQASKKPRASVSAEAFGNWNKKEEFKAPFFEKSAEQLDVLKQRLSQAFMFNALNPDELQIVLGAMQKVEKKPEEMVIKQGDDGDVLYVIESGTLSCFKN